MTQRAEAERQARLEREAAALRANLLKRKQQARSRKDSERPATDPKSGSGQD
jgi:hypothetical protein